MKNLLVILFLLAISLKSQAFSIQDFKVGDVILLDLDCPSCQIIEDETGSRFSHSGVVISNGRELFVAQALGKVHFVRIKTFLEFSRTRFAPRNQKYVVLRPVLNLRNFKKNHWKLYKNKYENVSFDHSYEWDDETLYCSEFLFKFMNELMGFKDLKTYKMDYTRNWEFWTRYFGHTPPQGKEGLAPDDFYRSSDFKVIFDSLL
ncbi:hypothetical protein A9Q84_01375 [Halobacteriovorax marinus]|uniref:Uncharacterized protein n=1 Tax=Halobacteriovorax marinus TaxID=97084 RepID=A0A1Y5FC49_9BACT|nr:hypothetical protein A9Q84_01375 [Halobacteriovorax marinus]